MRRPKRRRPEGEQVAHINFRKQATEAYAGAVVKGGILDVAPPWALAVYASLMVVALVGLGIVIFGRVQISVNARGVVRPAGGLLVIRAPVAGSVTVLCDCEGAAQQSGAVIAVIADRQTGSAVSVTAPVRGVVANLQIRRGEFVREGDPLGALIPADAALVGYLAVPERERPRLRVGGPVHIKLDGHPYQEAGIGEGRITRIGVDWLTEAWERDLKPGPGQDRSVLVEISLDRMPPRAGGAYQNGMQFTGELLVGRRRIARLLL